VLLYLVVVDGNVGDASAIMVLTPQTAVLIPEVWIMDRGLDEMLARALERADG